MAGQYDPICGMTGVIERDGRWFCSERCVAEFQRRADSSSGQSEPGAACDARVVAWYRDPWVLVPVSGIVLSTIGWWWPGAAAVSAIYVGYVKKVLAPFLAGLLIAGIVDYVVPREYVVRFLSGPRKRVIVRSTLLGFLASSCSHGCLALSVELYRKGASVPAVVSFLLASPWASMSLTLMLLSLFGLKGITIVVGALAIAFVTGLIFQQLALRGLIEPGVHVPLAQAPLSVSQGGSARWRRRWTSQQLIDDVRGVVKGIMPLGRMMLGWVQFGLVLSALLGGMVPHTVFVRFLGPSIGGLVLTLVGAAVIEVCSEGTAPLAFELYRHTGALGNAFAFLMGGVVTDYTELAVLWTVIGRRTTVWMVLITLPLVLVTGLVLNLWGGR